MPYLDNDLLFANDDYRDDASEKARYNALSHVVKESGMLSLFPEHNVNTHKSARIDRASEGSKTTKHARYMRVKGSNAMRVELFGGLRIYIDGEILSDSKWSKNKAKQVFAHIVLRFGRDIGRDTLIQEVWPEMTSKHARENLYVAISVAKSALRNSDGESPYIISRGELYRINADLVESDVEEFDILARKMLFGAKTPAEIEKLFVRMDQIYCGDILDGLKCDQYLMLMRERYRSTFVDAMLTASRSMMKSENLAGSLWFARKALSMEAKREDVYQVLMEAQLRSGQRTSAMETFFTCKEFLTNELGISLSKKTLDIYTKLLDEF